VSAFPKPPARNGRPSPLPLTVPVRIAVVGLGYWGPNLVRNLHELPEAEVAYVCDGRAEPLEAIQRRYPASRVTRSYDAVLNDPAVDAVAIATPVSSSRPASTSSSRSRWPALRPRRAS
jgi:N-acetyl-gamma-glutamylphosphate reductase